MDYFSWVSTRNCRRFYKRTYTLEYEIDRDLIFHLESYGVLEIIDLSKYSDKSKDLFKVKLENELEIAGTIRDSYLQVTISKQLDSVLKTIEGIINTWSFQKRKESLQESMR